MSISSLRDLKMKAWGHLAPIVFLSSLHPQDAGAFLSVRNCALASYLKCTFRPKDTLESSQVSFTAALYFGKLVCGVVLQQEDRIYSEGWRVSQVSGGTPWLRPT